MILRNMIRKVQDRLDDDVYWNDKRVIALLNEGKDELAKKLKCTTQQYYEFDSVAGQQKYQVPTTLVKSHLLFYNSGYNQEIHIHDDPNDIYTMYPDVTQEALPTKAYIWGASGRRDLVIYPTFNTDGITIKWWFYGWPEDIENDNDEYNFPTEWHPSLVKYAIHQAKVDDDELSVADALILWENEIRDIKSLDVTLALLSTSETRYGTVDAHFPRVGSGSNPLGLRITGDGDVIW